MAGFVRMGFKISKCNSQFSIHKFPAVTLRIMKVRLPPVHVPRGRT